MKYNPDHLRTAPLPSAGQSAAWEYRAIYLRDDQPVGQWRNPVGIAAMGGEGNAICGNQ